MITYTIKRGDTLDAIATRYNVPGGYEALARLNNIPNPDKIQAGATINIPEASDNQTATDAGMSDGMKTGLVIGGSALALGLAWWLS